MRKCPSCGSDIVYKTKQCWRQAEKANRRCKPCADEITRTKTHDETWRAEHSRALQAAWADPSNGLNSEAYRQKLSAAQIARTDDRSIGAFKAARKRRENGTQDAITRALQSPSSRAKRIASLIELHERKPELWQTEKAKVAWVVCGEKGKTYIDKAIAAAHKNGSRSAFERSFEDPLRSLGFLPTQRIGRWWVDYLNHDTKVVVECYGDWHHCHLKFDERVQRLYGGIHPELEMSPVDKRLHDEERVRDIESRGYTVIVIWQHDMKRWLSWIDSSLLVAKV